MRRRPGSCGIAVVLGMLTRIPVAGIACLTMPYLVGLERLGYDVYYLEEHGANPGTFMENGDGSAEASAYLDAVMRWFGFGGRWCFHALHSDGRYYGLSEQKLRAVLQSADVVLNLHGGTHPRPDHYATGNLVFVDTDPVGFQVELTRGDETARDWAEKHSAFFTWGENLGAPDCGVPVPPGIEFKPTRMPVLLDLWDLPGITPRDVFTTVGNWVQIGQDLVWNDEVYRWSKHHEFLKLLELPRRTSQPFELALSTYTPDVKLLLEEHGWRVRHGLHLSATLNAYRTYVAASRAEFTVAKDQNIRLRSGWFSDRSAAYLAAGRPVVTQDTAFGNRIPVGEGLFAFSTMDEIVAAVDAINADYARHSRAARELAREHFDSQKVLARLLDDLGLPYGQSPSTLPVADAYAFPADLKLEPTSRRPLTFDRETTAIVERRPLPFTLPALSDEPTRTSVIVPVRDNLIPTRLCLESLIANTSLEDEYEVIVVDNGSGAVVRDYLLDLARRNPQLRVVRNADNRGFPAAVNDGLAAAAGETYVLLNNDVVVGPEWLPRLLRPLRDRDVGLVGPMTNRAGTEAEITAQYETYGEFLRFAERRTTAEESEEPTSLTFFCAATRRDVVDRVGTLDARFGLGMFEDDDYVLRVRAAGYRLALATDVFVHHFGQATVGDPAAVPDFGALFHENRRRFEEKWATTWAPSSRRADDAYAGLVAQVRAAVDRAVPQDAHVFVVSKGDDALLDLDGRAARHFPHDGTGVYAGAHPASSDDAIAEVEALRSASDRAYLLFPPTTRWWLDHYEALQTYLETHCRRATSDEDACVIYEMGTP